MKNKILFLIIGIFILGVLVGLLVTRSFSTGNVVQETRGTYSYTTAICSTSQCIDVLVECSNGKVTSLQPISKLIEHDGSFRENVSDFCT